MEPLLQNGVSSSWDSIKTLVLNGMYWGRFGCLEPAKPKNQAQIKASFEAVLAF